MKFEQILVLATIVTGLIYWLDCKIWRKYRIAIDGSTLKREPIIVEYARSFFPVLLLVLTLRSFLIEPFRIPSGSMKPTLLVGDLIVVNKYTYGLRLPVLGTKLISINEPKRGEVVVFRHFDGNDLIKRVVGLPGDKIKYANKRLYINNELAPFEFDNITEFDQDDEQHTWQVRQGDETLSGHTHKIFLADPLVRDKAITYQFSETVVPPGKYFVLGDNRDNSHDSRFWGFVDDRDLVGKAFAIWFSWDSLQPWANKIRFSRIFTKLQ